MNEQVREIDFHLTNRCNLTCAHCSVDSGPGRSAYGEMGFDEWARVIDDAAALGVRYCDLTGGEPLLHPAVEQIVARISGWGMQSQLQSNGFLVTEKRLQPLADAGLATLVVSLDGDEKFHDRLRGRVGSYRAALAAISAGVTVGLKVRVTLVIVNDDHLESIAAFARCLEELGIHHLSLNYVSPVTPKHFRSYRLPDAARWHDFTESLEALAADLRYPLSYEVAFAQPQDLADYLGEETRCLIQRRRWFLIRSDGEVFPCYHFVHAGAMSLGNVRRDPLTFLVGGGNPAWSHYDAVATVPKECEGCGHARTCGGGCPSPGYLQRESLTVKDPRCQVERGFIPICPFIKRTAGTRHVTNIAPYYGGSSESTVS